MTSFFRTSGKLAPSRSSLSSRLWPQSSSRFGPQNAAFAQSATTGAIGGVVTDSGGALLPATAITVKAVDTGLVRTVKSTPLASIASPNSSRTYTATFAADGFQTYLENSITVTVGGLFTVSPQLKAGSVTIRSK